MDRAVISAAVVGEAERMLAEGAKRAAISARLGVTPYVVELIARNRDLRPADTGQPLVSKHRVANPSRGIDAVTIRMIRRMLAAGVLRQGEIAREVGVSSNMVAEVAAGKRLPVSTWRPYLQEGERFLPEPIRCSVCRANISVIPCRACRARREAAAKKNV